MKSFVRTKICGLRDPATARQVASMGADAIGLVFYPPSPRAVDAAVARSIIAALPPFVQSVGLFVDMAADELHALLAAVPLDLLQFHGDEEKAYCEQFSRPYIKAIRVKAGVNLLQYAASFCGGWCKGVLVDAWVDGVPGGTGEAFDWSLLPKDLPLPLILSGGLHPGNVAEAVRRVTPWAVDVSSGVEQTRGVKDLAKVEAFLTAVHSVLR